LALPYFFLGAFLFDSGDSPYNFCFFFFLSPPQLFGSETLLPLRMPTFHTFAAIGPLLGISPLLGKKKIFLLPNPAHSFCPTTPNGTPFPPRRAPSQLPPELLDFPLPPSRMSLQISSGARPSSGVLLFLWIEPPFGFFLFSSAPSSFLSVSVAHSFTLPSSIGEGGISSLQPLETPLCHLEVEFDEDSSGSSNCRKTLV